MDFVTPLYQTLQAQATLDQTRATTQDTQALAQIRQYGLMQTIQAQQAIAKELERQNNQQTFSNPTGIPADGPLGAIGQQLQRLDQQAGQMDSMSRAVMPIDQKRAEEYSNSAAKIREQIAAKSIDALKEKAALGERLGGIAGAVSVGDQDGLMSAITRMNAVDPSAVRSIAMDRDPATGMPLATPRTIAAMQQYSLGSMKASDQMLNQHRIAVEQQTLANQKRLEQSADENRQLRADIANQSAGLRQQGLSVEQARLSSLDQNRQINIAERVANSYTRDSKDFIEKVPFIKSATNYLFDDEGKMRPSSAMTPAGDKALAEAYVKTVFPDYKGSVYDKKGLDQLAGLPTRFVQYFVNLAEGKEFPQSVRTDMFNAMQNQFKNENAQQMEREDNYRQRLTNGRVDPSLIDAYLQPYALRPTAAATKSKTGGNASADRVPGPDGRFYNYIGGPGGDRTLKSNWRPD